MVWFRQVCTESPTFYRVKYANIIKFSGFFLCNLESPNVSVCEKYFFADVKAKGTISCMIIYLHKLRADLSLIQLDYCMYIPKQTFISAYIKLFFSH